MGLGACAHPGGYGVSDAALAQQAQQRDEAKQDRPDSAKVYLTLIEQMQQKGLYFASLAHLDEYEHEYGVAPAHDAAARGRIAHDGPVRRERGRLPFPARHAACRAGLSRSRPARGRTGATSRQPRSNSRRAVDASPTEAELLSDLAYARLREGDLADARVPIMKAAELDQKNPKILSNLAIYLLANGQVKNANSLMDAQNMPREVRDAVHKEAAAVGAAAHAWNKRSVSSVQQGTRNE